MKKNSYSEPSYNPRTIRPADQAKGEQGERRFQAWLNTSGVPFIYLDQSPLSVPAHLRGLLKRPDFEVGLPGVGRVAFDVKVKNIYAGHFIFELNEIVRMRNYSTFFNTTVYFACLDPSGSGESYWIRLDHFNNRMPVRRDSDLTLSIRADEVQSVSMDKPFQDALTAATRLV